MARVVVNPRIGAEAKPKVVGSNQRDMRDILGVFDQLVYDTGSKKYLAAVRSDLPG